LDLNTEPNIENDTMALEEGVHAPHEGSNISTANEFIKLLH